MRVSDKHLLPLPLQQKSSAHSLRRPNWGEVAERRGGRPDLSRKAGSGLLLREPPKAEGPRCTLLRSVGGTGDP